MDATICLLIKPGYAGTPAIRINGLVEIMLIAIGLYPYQYPRRAAVHAESESMEVVHKLNDTTDGATSLESR